MADNTDMAPKATLKDSRLYVPAEGQAPRLLLEQLADLMDHFAEYFRLEAMQVRIRYDAENSQFIVVLPETRHTFLKEVCQYINDNL